MKRICAIALVLFFFSLAAAQPGASSPGQNNSSSLERELKAITREMHDALLRGDKERLFSFFADDFIGTSYDGFTATKEEFIKNFRMPPPEAKITRDIEEFKVRGNSESAIVSYRLIEHVEIGDQQTGGQCLYTDTFVRREGRWQLLASQATRIESEPKIANIAPSVYDAYVGHYALTPSLIFTVTREGDKLIGQAPDGSRVELLPENETTFFVRGRAGRTIFVKDDRGQVTHMIIKSEGDGTRMKKID